MTTRINLLPWREMRRKQQDRQLLFIAASSWVLMGAILGFVYVHMGTLIETQNLRNKYLQDEIAKVEKDIKEISEIKKQRQDLVARMNIIYQLQGDRTAIVHMFDELARRLPEGVYLKNLRSTGNSVSLQGSAQSNARVSALMRSLSASNWFANPELEIINVREQGGDRLSEFSLSVKRVAKQQKPLEAGT